MPRVTVETGNVLCRRTEDVGALGSKDELYLLGSIQVGAKSQSVLTDKLKIDDGERRNFRNKLMFKGDVADGKSLAFSLGAYEADSGGSWKERRALIDLAQRKIEEEIRNRDPGGGDTSASSTPPTRGSGRGTVDTRTPRVPIGTIPDPTGGQAANLFHVVTEVLQSAGEADKDDVLGGLSTEYPIFNSSVSPYNVYGMNWEFFGDDSSYLIHFLITVVNDGITDAELDEFLKEVRRKAKIAGF